MSEKEKEKDTKAAENQDIVEEKIIKVMGRSTNNKIY